MGSWGVAPERVVGVSGTLVDLLCVAATGLAEATVAIVAGGARMADDDVRGFTDDGEPR